MIPQQSLVEFVREAASRGFSKEEIAETLRRAGWQEADISAGLVASSEGPAAYEGSMPSLGEPLVNSSPHRRFNISPRYLLIAGGAIIVLGAAVFFGRNLLNKKTEQPATATLKAVEIPAQPDGKLADYDESKYQNVEIVDNGKGCLAAVLTHKEPDPVGTNKNWPEQRSKDIAFNGMLIKNVNPNDRFAENLFFSEDCTTLVFGSYNRLTYEYSIYRNNEPIKTDVKIDSFRFEPKTKKIYYYGTANDAEGKPVWYLYADAKKFGPFTGSPKSFYVENNRDFVRFSPNGQHYAFLIHEMVESAPTASGAVSGSSRQYVIADGKDGEQFGWIHDFQITDDGNLSYLAGRDDSAVFYFHNGKSETIPVSADKESGIAGAVLSPDGSQYIITKEFSDERYLMIINGKETETYVSYPYINSNPSFSSDGRHYEYHATTDGKNYFSVLDGQRSDLFPLAAKTKDEGTVTTFVHFTPDNVLYFDVASFEAGAPGSEGKYSTCLYRNNLKAYCQPGIFADWTFEGGSYAFVYRQPLGGDKARHSIIFNGKDYGGVNYDQGGVLPPVISPDGSTVAYMSPAGIFANERKLHSFMDLSEPLVEFPLITKDNRVVYILSRFIPAPGSPLIPLIEKGITTPEAFENLQNQDESAYAGGTTAIEVYVDEKLAGKIDVKEGTEEIVKYFLSRDGKSLRYVVKDSAAKQLILKSVSLGL